MFGLNFLVGEEFKSVNGKVTIVAVSGEGRHGREENEVPTLQYTVSVGGTEKTVGYKELEKLIWG